MVALVIVVLALAVSAAVLVVASATPDRSSATPRESPWQAFRRGLAARGAVPATRPVDLSLGEMISQVGDGGDAYVTTAELQQTWERARERAVESTSRALPLTRTRVHTGA